MTITKEKHKKPKELVIKEKTPKIKKSSTGLCASCFGAKAAEKKKKEVTSETAKAPVEQKKVVEEEKKDEILTTPTIESLPPPTDNIITLSDVNIDTYQERPVQQGAEVKRHST